MSGMTPSLRKDLRSIRWIDISIPASFGSNTTARRRSNAAPHLAGSAATRLGCALKNCIFRAAWPTPQGGSAGLLTAVDGQRTRRSSRQLELRRWP